MSVQYRQGDVLLRAVPRLPEDAEPVAREGGRVVLAHGEATGHSHAIAEPHAHLFASRDDELNGITDRYLDIVGSSALLTHEEHDPLTVPAGRYLVLRQREFTGDTATRDVTD
ncbi:hypothetical protein [Streptomyces sp. NPDC018833]|uniref:hypothetical protein n=1 Tax=Streptomyces sp. NPDC018833 TaxID=3365053 RepID=UPI0037B77E7A